MELEIIFFPHSDGNGNLNTNVESNDLAVIDSNGSCVFASTIESLIKSLSFLISELEEINELDVWYSATAVYEGNDESSGEFYFCNVTLMPKTEV